jgi:PERQ amino acid-rich with GYF domain-containing protein
VLRTVSYTTAILPVGALFLDCLYTKRFAVDNFASTLTAFPLIPEIISDAIYANSKTMDGRHFAQEFIRRKKLAEKGVVEKQPISSPSADTQTSSAGGWNEVAKKSSHKEPANDANTIQAAGFKVVPSRKKGKK